MDIIVEQVVQVRQVRAGFMPDNPAVQVEGRLYDPTSTPWDSHSVGKQVLFSISPSQVVGTRLVVTPVNPGRVGGVVVDEDTAVKWCAAYDRDEEYAPSFDELREVFRRAGNHGSRLERASLYVDLAGGHTYGLHFRSCKRACELKDLLFERQGEQPAAMSPSGVGGIFDGR